MGRANGEPANVVGPDGGSYRRGRRGLATLAAASTDSHCEVVRLTQPALTLARAIARQATPNYIVHIGNDGVWVLSLRNGHRVGSFQQREQALAEAARRLNADKLGGRILIHEVNGSTHEQVEPSATPIPDRFVLSVDANTVIVSRPGGAPLGQLEPGSTADRAAAALKRGLPVQAQPVVIAPPDDVPDMVGWLGKFKLFAAVSFES